MNPFENVIERRGTHSMKWDRLNEVYGLKDSSDVLPMWVADMDFKAPDVVLQAMQEQLDYGVFGYSFVSEEAKDAVRHWLQTRYRWTVENEWMIFHQGVVPAIASIIETFTEADDGILITTPVYPPFFNVPERLKRTMVECEMIEDDGIYSIDFVAFEKALQQNVKLFILCNPHNPGGLVWGQSDLEKMVELCKKYDVLILSDEIHADLVFPEYEHTALGAVAGDEADRVITCVAPTKTFNLAGVQACVMLSPNQGIREKLEANEDAHGGWSLNTFAAAALQAAYEKGGPWLDELLEVISKNMDYVIEELPKAIPEIHIQKPHGTYLLWIDYRETGLSEEDMMDKLLKVGKLALEPGTKYGEAGRGFLRMNVACPLSTVKDGVKRFIKALE